MKPCSSARIVFTALLTFVLLHLAGVEAFAASGPEGQVQYVIMTDPSWDQYTGNPSPAMQQWFRANSWRIETFSPYFDTRLKWDPDAWSYLDLYAIYQGSSVLAAHPEWVLKDSYGNPLYIPWGCGGGTCPQYAADVSNPAYRSWWISQAQQFRTIGYKGLWIDDVNMDLDVGNGSGSLVAPVDNQTGQPMLAENWRMYMAEFTEQIRAAFPGWEIVHNAVWGADTPTRTADSYIQREIAAANYINLERGVVDPGLTGGTWLWSLNALFGYIDAVHSFGSNVVLDNAAGSIEYGLASYFLISNGGDAVSSQSMMPNAWWNGFAVNLGSALGARTNWQNVYRRDFTGGMVLVNPPQSPSVTLTLPGTFYRVDGTAVTQVTLAAADGAVLLGSVPTGTFTLSPSPSTLTVTAGNGGTSTITVGSSNGYTSAVNVTVSGCPASTICGVTPSPVTPPSGGSTTTTLTVSTTMGTAAGTYKLTVGGNSGAQTTTVTLVVQAPVVQPVPDFSLSASPNSLSLQAGSQGASTVVAGSVNGFSSAVNLAVSGCPANTTCTLSQPAVTPPNGGSASSILTVATTGNTTPGVYTLTVAGNGGVHNATLLLTITAVPVVPAPVVPTPVVPTPVVPAVQSPNFSLSAGGPLTVMRGHAASTGVTVTPLGGFSGSITAVVTGCPAGVGCKQVVLTSAGGVVSVFASWIAVPGTATLTVTATSGSTVHSLQIPLTVN